MSHDKPKPLYPDSVVRRRCPICGAIAYSREGIHPQCAMAQADAPRTERLKRIALEDKQRARKILLNYGKTALRSEIS
jgi:hypothetical protein